MNNTSRICPNCQAAVPSDAPAGICPACALRAGFDTASGPESVARTIPSQPSTQPAPPDRIAGLLPELEDFQLIGQGGMAAVYRARHCNLRRPVAVKVLSEVLGANPDFVERFTREARTLAQLDHPNVVRVYDFGHREGLSYLVMELVDGVSLRQTIEAGGLTPQEALAMVPEICGALQYAHDKGVVHRDIKPENILVDRTGSIKIADFGLAKLIGEDPDRRLTRAAQVMGTPHYMAPEQFENTGGVDHRADIFALGVVFYELLTGELPLGRFAPPSQMVKVDVRLDEVVLRTLEKEPRLRYQQASELRSDVVSISAGRDPGSGGAALAGSAPAAASPAPSDFEYRSERTLFGLPLIHIASSRDPAGKRMRTANGIIAIGDIAIGAVAVGAFSFGGITFGGINVGLLGFGGITVGLLTALGGCAFGGFSVGGLAIGGAAAVGALPVAAMDLAGAALERVTTAGWVLMTAGVSVGVGTLIKAWAEVVRTKDPGPDQD